MTSTAERASTLLFLLAPRPVRDAVYDFIGTRRYRLFGRTDKCWVPDEDISDRFLYR